MKIKKWIHFCNEKSVDLLYSTVNLLLEFLHFLCQHSLGYSALNTVRSPAYNIDENSTRDESDVPVGKLPLISRYLKGIFNKLKPVPKYQHIWSVDKVLEYRSKCWPLNEISRKEPTSWLC